MPTVALLSDFGTRDHYVGAMKGVVLSVCPGVTLVDLTHEIAPQDIAGGARALAAAYRYFPPGTVFLAVVDPGVGSSRRGIAAAAGGWWFVGPDNGLLTAVFAETPPEAIVELRAAAYARREISRTFEGRDRFAPAAGWLARGTALGALGPAVTDPVLLPLPHATRAGEVVTGEVVRIDRFGNAITNIPQSLLPSSAPLAIRAGGHRLPLVATYADLAPDQPGALLGSDGHLEIAVRNGNAADHLQISRGTPVTIEPPS